jgi:hypothetical protein
MSTDERKDRENETLPETKKDEKISDLSAKKLNPDEEDKVKGGLFRPTSNLL